MKNSLKDKRLKGSIVEKQDSGYIWCPGHKLGGQQITVDVCITRQTRNPKLCRNAGRKCRHFKETA